ncbi:MAG TPA: hypothetical protein DIW44_07550 [Anaerolineaceae bacterium]|nr:hypothetical protein [Anaerolineaceae bacterium]
MDFLQAEAQFRQLDAQYKAGQISYDQYRNALIQLQVTDGSGGQWQLQELTGQWHTLTNGQWIAAQPPKAAAFNPSSLSFSQAEQQFAALEAQYQAGQITMEYYRTVLAQLEVIDEDQNRWQMQERTGAWHVLWQGQWVASTPPGKIAPPVIPSSAIAPPQQISYAQAGYPYQVNQTQKKSPWGVIGIVAGGLVVVVLAVFGISALIKGVGGSSSKVKTYDFVQQSTLTLNPGGGQVQDDLGTTLQVAAEALPAEDSVTNLTSYAASGPLEKELSQSYILETPFYEVTLEGANDGSGPAELTFLAPNPNSRLLMIIDMQAAILLAVEPRDGELKVNAHLGPTDLSVLYPEGEGAETHSVMYVVVTPKQTSYEPSETGSSTIQMVSNRLPQENYGKMCTPVSLKAATIFQRCQSNEDGSVMVIYPSDDKMTHIDAYHAAIEIESAVATYLGMGYTNSYLDPSSPILAVVSASYTSPEYNFKNGVIYLPPDIPTKLAAERTAIWHETGHWIQNRVYSMAIAKAVGARSWWLDVSAELMVMDVMPEYLSDNLSTYGKITKDDGVMLAFQSAPYQWPADFYVHAQLVKVNMCDLGCPITRDDFVRAINKGLYPFNGNYEREMLTGNLEDYARYLLGAAPEEANTTISLAGVQNQDSFGQIVSVIRGNNTLVKYIHNGVEPQIKEEKTQTGSNLVIDAALEADGVYPLQITSGSDGKYTGLPLMLVVEPGVPFLYRLDGGEVVSSDGSKEEKIGPLQAGTGVGTIRLVAYSAAGGQSFKAKVESVNLDGTWMIEARDMISSNMQCTGGVGEEATDPNDMGALGAAYFTFFNAMGEMTTDSSGQTLDWSLVPGRLPAEVTSGMFTFEATAITETDGIHLQGRLNIPKPSDSSGFIPGMNSNVAGLTPDGVVSRQLVPMAGAHDSHKNASLALVLLLPVVGMSLLPISKKRQRMVVCIAMGMMLMSLAGCIALIFYGTVDADIKITKFEYAGGSGPASWTFGSPVSGNPIWVFKEGTATYPVELMMDVTMTDADGKETDFHEVCSGTAVYAVTGGVYEDMTVIIPSSSDE